MVLQKQSVGKEFSIIVEKHQRLSPLAGFLIATYVLLDPFYFWASGLPQISDFLLVILILYVALLMPVRGFINPRGKLPVRLLAVFIYYSFLINLIWSLVYPDDSLYLRNFLYIFFGFATFVAFFNLSVHYRSDVSRVLYRALVGSVSIQVSLMLVMAGSQGLRTTLFFNNPNQLGYYALLAASLMTLLHFGSPRKKIVHFTGLFFCGFLALASLSRGAIAATMLILLLNVLFDSDGRKLRPNMSVPKILLVCSSLATLLFVFRSTLEGLLQSWEDRVQTRGKISSEGLTGRGYERILDNPQHWAFGAGRGSPERFDAVNEIHSTLGSIFFSYGLIGTALFLGALFVIVKRYPATLPLFGAIFIYGMTHDGIRAGFFWIFVAISAAAVVKVSERRDSKAKKRSVHVAKQSSSAEAERERSLRSMQKYDEQRTDVNKGEL